MPDKITIADIKHPSYRANIDNWELWRNTYEAGQYFIDNYLQKFSIKEDDDDFKLRKSISYCPAFAKAAVNDVKNSIYQRMNDISREGGVTSYQTAIKGDLFGVDLLGSSMNSFIGQKILPELLVMRKVGVYVDMPNIKGTTLRESFNKRPYLYMFTAEEITSWEIDYDANPNEFSKIVLREDFNTYDELFGMPDGSETGYRYIHKVPGGVLVEFYNSNGEMIGEPQLLDLPFIPFVVFEISDSLLTDVANYQIALLNLASSDINYSLRSNFPFYVEQYDPIANSQYLQGDENKNVPIGPSYGKKYPINTNQPAFINPSSEPLKVSIEKQEQLKQEIKQLINSNVSNLSPKQQASAESKSLDNQGLEAGLSYIGLELERGERRIANFWALYENAKNKVATVNYPEKYSLKSDSEQRAEAKDLSEQATKIPSKTYQKEMNKRIARVLLGNKIASTVLAKIEKEIDSADVLTSDPTIIQKDLEAGLVDTRTASIARGYPEGCVEKAEEDHTNRLVRIANTQGGLENSPATKNPGARGIKDLASTNNQGREEKKQSRDTTQDSVVTDKTRGEGKDK